MSASYNLACWNAYYAELNRIPESLRESYYLPSPKEIDTGKAEIRRQNEPPGNPPREIHPLGTQGMFR